MREREVLNVGLSDLYKCAVVTVPNDALNSSLWTLLEPGAELLEVHRRSVPDPDASM